MASDWQHMFDILTASLSQLTLTRKEGDRKNISILLDKINLMNFKRPVVSNLSKAILLVHQCCTLVLPDDSELVSKCCKVIQNLIFHQNVVLEGQTLIITIRWILQAIKNSSDALHFELLITLNAILKSSKKHLNILMSEIIVYNSPLLQILENKNPEIILSTLQILEICTSTSEDEKLKKLEYQNEYTICAILFKKILTNFQPSSFDDLIFSKVLICCLKGLQNVIQQNQRYLEEHLGLLLGISKSYMVYYLPNVNFVIPQIITPSNFALAEANSVVPREKKGGKVTRQRKSKSIKTRKDLKGSDSESELSPQQPKPQYSNRYVPVNNFSADFNYNDVPSPVMKASDSEFSDTEGGKAAKVKIVQGRVRQAALSLLYQIINLTEKSKIFSFWSSFIPDRSSSSKHNLRTCILYEPSSRGKVAALNVLLAFLTSSKMYLFQAESSSKYSSFTPFSAMLGETIEELHKSLCLALNENSFSVLIQCLKCLAALVQSTPYHRLRPGLLSKVIRNVKLFIKHKDSPVQVASLIVLGCVLASEPVVPETKQSFLRQTFKYSVHNPRKLKTVAKNDNGDDDVSDDEFQYANFSSDEEEISDDTCSKPISWLLQTCINNLMFTDPTTSLQVKLESLQIISAMTRSYFESLMVPHFSLITLALISAFHEEDQGPHLRFHTGRTIDFIGQKMALYFNTKDNDKSLSTEKGLEFWLTLMNGPLIELVQDDSNPSQRATGCDCLGSIGPHLFERLPRDKQILTVTQLFTRTRDSESIVRASAVRSLGICVQYPILKEDMGFVMDVGETVLRTIQDQNVGVKIKSAWSLGNLSDSLVASKDELNKEEIPLHLLKNLFKITIISSDQNDKVKMNTVRALGNFIQLIDERILENVDVRKYVEDAFGVLVKCATTGTQAKVRWNACYALGNALKNDKIYFENPQWMGLVFSSLSSLVINYRNFKVRINAGFALSSPSHRKFYGAYYHSVWVSLLRALENVENMEDFSEYQHRDHLVEQICFTIAHLTNLLEPDDLYQLQDHLNFYEELLCQQVHQVIERVIPEKSVILITCAEHLKKLNRCSENLSSDQKSALNCLMKIFCSNNVTSDF